MQPGAVNQRPNEKNGDGTDGQRQENQDERPTGVNLAFEIERPEYAGGNCD